jgi:hypothetical protein
MLDMIPALAGSSAGGGALANFFSKLGTGGLGGFLSGLGNATGVPVSQALGIEASPMNSFGQLLGSGLMGDFSGVGQAYMLGGGMNPQMSAGGMSPITDANIPGQISQAEAMRMLEEMQRQQQAVGQNMMMPLDTMTDPRTLMGGLLGSPMGGTMGTRQI